MTPEGAQRVLDYRVFRHNFQRFPIHDKKLRAKYERWRALIRKNRDDSILCGQANHFASQFRKIDKWWGNYQYIWEEYFAL